VHALAQTLVREGHAFDVTPGNAATDELSPVSDVSGLTPDALEAYAGLARPALTVWNDTHSLVQGAANRFRARGLAVCGPDYGAAWALDSRLRIERLLRRADVPRPRATTVWCAADFAHAVLPEGPVIVKNELLNVDARGRLRDTRRAAYQTVGEMAAANTHDLRRESTHGAIVVQEALDGPRVSAFVVTDGERLAMLALSHEHQRHRLGDVPRHIAAATPEIYAPLSSGVPKTIYELPERLVAQMRQDEIPYRGLLRVEMVLAEQYGGQPVVEDISMRWRPGDAQVVLPLLGQYGVHELLHGAATRLPESAVLRAHLGHVAATTALPAPVDSEGRVCKGAAILGLDTARPNGVVVHHDATIQREDAVVATGLTPLHALASGETEQAAEARLRQAFGSGGIHFVK
jgi:phosphoribosylamine--glycine ligase